MTKAVVVSPICGKESSIELAGVLNLEHQMKADLRWKWGNTTHIINYGCSDLPPFDGIEVLNKPRAVRRSLNKLRTFDLLKGHVKLPTVTQDKEEAKKWARSGRKVVVRSQIKGNSNHGMFVTDDPTEIDEAKAKFYSRFIENKEEWRVYCWRGKVVSVYRKIPCKNGKGEDDWLFKFKKDEELNKEYRIIAEQVYEHLGLDMCGLDVLETAKGNYFLLEVNSATIMFPITQRRMARLINQEFLA